jgi:P-type Ca2+ transporter type 2C
MVVSVIAGGEDASVFTIIQLLWINLIMDTFAALSLSTDYPSKGLLERKPEPRSSSILNTRMWKLIIGQALYQIIVIFTLHYGGSSIFSYNTESQLVQLQTMIFNTYVWMQIANQIK